MGQYPEFDFDRVDYVTSDTHVGHARISELAHRPFASVEEMDAELVRRWNELVGPDDIVLHLGDLALGPIEQSLALTSMLNGHRFRVQATTTGSRRRRSRNERSNGQAAVRECRVDDPLRGDRRHAPRVSIAGLPLPLRRGLARRRPAHDTPAPLG